MGNFISKVLAHTIAARQRWAFMAKKPTQKSLWNQVLTEEIGKLNRACNKLSLATDPQVREQWTREARERLVIIASICLRFYEAFDNLFDTDSSYSKEGG